MPPLSFEQFLKLVERSTLIEPPRLSELTAAWQQRADAGEPRDAEHFARFLVASDAITGWQAKKLLDGRHRGFVLGRYKLLDHLGSGGMSSVYLAEHVLMHRRAAIKVLPQNRADDAMYLTRFHFEAQAAAALDHENIVRIYDMDREGRIHYLVMEYIDGRDLDDLVAHEGPLDVHRAAAYTLQAAAGLEHAHAARLVHRDIKPANLLVDRQGTVKILDLGLAKFADGAPQATARDEDLHVVGTADYLAPEQVSAISAVDHRADIYALGCTLYFLLTGRTPFPDGTPAERMAAHQRRSPPALESLRPEIPAPLVEICRRMMQKSPDERFQTAREVREALDAWLSDELAAGRFMPQNAAMQHWPEGAMARARGAAKSRISLVSGSQLDLAPAEDLATAGFAGARPPTPPVHPPSLPSGAAITSDKPPIEPPPPPRTIPHGDPRPGLPVGTVAGETSAVLPLSTRRKRLRADRPLWFWIVFLSSLLVCAILFGAFVLPGAFTP